MQYNNSSSTIFASGLLFHCFVKHNNTIKICVFSAQTPQREQKISLVKYVINLSYVVRESHWERPDPCRLVHYRYVGTKHCLLCCYEIKRCAPASCFGLEVQLNS